MKSLIATLTSTSLLTSLLMIAGCASSEPPAPQATEKVATLVDEYRIGPDDTIMVSVWGNEELSVSGPVRPDGMITLPLIGDVKAGGRIPSEVATDIETQLAGYVREPKVAVILTSLASHEYVSRIRVTGAVGQNISVPYRQGMTVLDAVLAAGGLNDFAAGNKTKIYRRSNDGPVVLSVKMDDITKTGRLATNYDLQPGDVITVPERIF